MYETWLKFKAFFFFSLLMNDSEKKKHDDNEQLFIECYAFFT